MTRPLYPMALVLCLAAFAFAAPSAALAEGGSPLHALMTGDDSRGWQGVGRLNIGGNSFCTGALISDRLVLTAAHCMFDKRTGRRYGADEIKFLAGWRNGRAAAYRGARRVVVHPGFKAHGEDRTDDLALIELDQPIHKSAVTPFGVADLPPRGAEVGVVSYAKDRAEAPSLQKVCHVLGDMTGTLVLDCDVDFGSSGAPIFDMSTGEPLIVSVVSAKANAGGAKVSLGTSLEGPLSDLKAQLAAGGDGVLSQVRPTVTRMTPDEAADTSGAKFLRP